MFTSPILISLFAALATQVVALDLGGLPLLNLNPNILTPGNNLINVNALASVLSASTCAAGNALVGITVAIPPLVGACVCATVPLVALGLQATCPSCVANAEPICAGQCGCACGFNFFADASGTCVPRTTCALPNVLIDLPTGTSTCVCAAGFISNGLLGCSLAPSVRRRSVKKDQTTLCPLNETACSLASGGYECLDVTSSLDSCGGCLGHGGVNCLGIPGALAVECRDSECSISSCFPGWIYRKGACVRA